MGGKVLWYFISLGKFKVIPFKSSARYLVWSASVKHKIKSYGMSGEMYVGPRQERSQKGDSGCASEKLGVPHLLSD